MARTDIKDFTLRLARLGCDATAGILFNVGSSLLASERPDLGIALLGIATAALASESSVSASLDQRKARLTTEQLAELINTHGGLRSALTSIASGASASELMPTLNAKIFLELVDGNADNRELSKQQNEILFAMCRWLESWEQSNTGAMTRIHETLEANHAEIKLKIGSSESETRQGFVRINEALKELIARVPIPPKANEELPIKQYLQWLSNTTGTFTVPGLGVSLSIASDWAKLRVMATVEKPTESLVAELKRYQEWQRLGGLRVSRNEEIEGSHITNFSSKVIVVAGPGAGKSTLQKRLAYQAAANGKIAILIRLKQVARALKNGSTFEEAVTATAFDGSGLLQRERIAVLGTAGLLLADGLDEADPFRVDVAQGLHRWSAGHPETEIVVTTRPVGHDPGLFPNWKHAELLPFSNEDVKTQARRMLNALHGDDSPKVEIELLALQANLEEHGAAALAARNPLLLGFVLRLLVEQKAIPRGRPELMAAVVNMMMIPSISDRSILTLPESTARRAMEILGSFLLFNPAAPKTQIVSALAVTLGAELQVPRLAAENQANLSLSFWEERCLVETLSTGADSTVAFIHASLGEYAAGLYASNLDEMECADWIERVRRLSNSREPLIFAAALGNADQVVKSLLAADSPDDPTAIESLIATAAILESGQVSQESIRSVVSALAAKLESPVPMVVYEAALALMDLIKLDSDFIGHKIVKLQDNEQPWTAMAAIAMAIHAGHKFVSIKALNKSYDKIMSRERESDEIFLSKSPWSDLRQRSIVPLTACLLTLLPGQETNARVRAYWSLGNLPGNLYEKFEQVLKTSGAVGPNEVPEYMRGQDENLLNFTAGFARMNEGVKNVILAIAQVAGQMHSSTESKLPPLPENELAKVVSALGVFKALLPDLIRLHAETNGLLQQSVKGAIIASQADPKSVFQAASELLSNTGDGLSMLSKLKDIYIKPKWFLVPKDSFSAGELAKGLCHSSSIVSRPAAELLAAGVGGEERQPELLNTLRHAKGHAIFNIAIILEDVFGSNCIKIAIDRLSEPLCEGCEGLFKCIPHYEARSSDSRLGEISIRALYGPVEVAAGAADFLCEMPNVVVSISELKQAFDYWKLHEEPYPTEGGVVPPSPREKIVRAIAQRKGWEIDELVILCSDQRFNVKEEAIAVIVELAVSKDVRDLIMRIQQKSIPVEALSQMAEKYPEELKKASDLVLPLISAADKKIRLAAIGALVFPWLARDEARRNAQLALNDHDEQVRNKAVKVLRALGQIQ